MPSRIDIGPEGGPFVAINENSNDLELQDINGNVIAKWDETAGQWDLNNNSLTNINAIDASSATFGGAIKQEGYSLNIDDDDIATISAPPDRAMASVTADAANVTAIYALEFAGLRTAAQGTAVTNQDEEELSGTTGPDGSFNVARSEGDLYLENRTGGSVTANVLIIGPA